MSSRLPFALDPAREEAELRDYLGDDFDLSKLQQYQQTLDAEYEQVGSEECFYRVSRAYLYNLTAFAMTGTKLPYLAELVKRVPRGGRILEYGCGIGTDGLMLLDAGYRVEFADFDNPSTEYLRWRLARRGLEAPVHDLDLEVPGGFDAAFAFDVIEHVSDGFRLLGEMERRAKVVEVNFLDEKHDQALHHELPVADLVRHAARRNLLFYRVFHGGSHLVIYESESAGATSRLAGRVRIAGGRARRLAKR